MYTIVYTDVPKQLFPGGHVNRLPSLAYGGLFERGKRFGWWYGVRSRQKRPEIVSLALKTTRLFCSTSASLYKKLIKSSLF